MQISMREAADTHGAVSSSSSTPPPSLLQRKQLEDLVVRPERLALGVIVEAIMAHSAQVARRTVCKSVAVAVPLCN